MRSLRPFLRWMSDHGIVWADGIHFRADGSGRWGVYAGRDMEEGEPIVRIPKESCLTASNTGAAAQIEAACLGGGLALAVAVMYERSRGASSPWHAYLAVLPRQEDVPIAWGAQQVHHLLCGTELHQTVLEDLRLIRQDWLDCIAPLSEEDPATFPPAHFTLADYLAAKTLISSRAFAIDRHHTMGMLPFADMLNHKTAAEDVHLMIGDGDGDSDDESSLDSDEEAEGEDDVRQQGDSGGTQRAHEMAEDGETTEESRRKGSGRSKRREPETVGPPGQENGGRGPKRRKGSGEGRPGKGDTERSNMDNGSPEVGHRVGVGEPAAVVEDSGTRQAGEEGEKRTQENGTDEKKGRNAGQTDGGTGRGQAGAHEDMGGEAVGESASDELEMVLLHDLQVGREVFNTYGRLSSGALLYRYGFTEHANPFDLVNLDAYKVAAAAAAAPGCTARQVRSRWALWRAALGSSLTTQAWQYFEIGCGGQPEAELLLLLYVIHAPEAAAAALGHHPGLPACAGDVHQVAALLGYGHPDPTAGDRDKSRQRPAQTSEGRKTKVRTSRARHLEVEEARTGGDVRDGGEQAGCKKWCPEEDPVQDWLLTSEVVRSLLRALDAREEAYRAGPLAHDEALWAVMDGGAQPRAYHALALRIAERQVLQRCRETLRARLTRNER
ncbi:hypothetical protein KFL_007340050 [Klebsormidium nitens]|uniref:Uncharacterized protein n=1 Tax=Klebsormidium nitens TaxID=105231 RepID=A0A1Y1IJW0_KLENI|nr:hypothetical protein KFL_007340050 [Klebsormidium nitens]|eukprot:GAQ91145.1 hypothetical protein KFL_007340050 [Klebsormidium nitens]